MGDVEINLHLQTVVSLARGPLSIWLSPRVGTIILKVRSKDPSDSTE